MTDSPSSKPRRGILAILAIVGALLFAVDLHFARALARANAGGADLLRSVSFALVPAGLVAAGCFLFVLVRKPRTRKIVRAVVLVSLAAALLDLVLLNALLN